MKTSKGSSSPTSPPVGGIYLGVGGAIGSNVGLGSTSASAGGSPAEYWAGQNQPAGQYAYPVSVGSANSTGGSHQVLAMPYIPYTTQSVGPSYLYYTTPVYSPYGNQQNGFQGQNSLPSPKPAALQKPAEASKIGSRQAYPSQYDERDDRSDLHGIYPFTQPQIKLYG